MNVKKSIFAVKNVVLQSNLMQKSPKN